MKAYKALVEQSLSAEGRDGHNMSVGLVYDPVYLGHDTGDHVENGRRLERTVELLSSSNLRRQLVSIAPEPAAMDDLLRVHSAQHIARVDRSASPREAGGWTATP